MIFGAFGEEDGGYMTNSSQNLFLGEDIIQQILGTTLTLHGNLDFTDTEQFLGRELPPYGNVFPVVNKKIKLIKPSNISLSTPSIPSTPFTPSTSPIMPLLPEPTKLIKLAPVLLSQTEPEPVLLPQTEPDAELDCIQARLRLKEIKRQIKEIKTMREEEIKDFTPKQRKEYNYLRRKFMNVHYARRRRAAKRKEKSKN